MMGVLRVGTANEPSAAAKGDGGGSDVSGGLR